MGINVRQQAGAPAFGCPLLRGLESLALSDEHLGALARQGFVSHEHRGQRGPFFKLRFRFEGKQIVRYLGTDAENAERVRSELLALQQGHHLGRQVERHIIEAGAALRAAKRGVQRELGDTGFHFHGLAIRKKLKTRC